jgi:hypothetical protein
MYHASIRLSLRRTLRLLVAGLGLALLLSAMPALPVAANGGAWSPTGSLITGRLWNTTTLLADGRVLVAGGRSSAGALGSAEVYDPSTGVWTATGNMLTARKQHVAARLADGRVLVTGGYNDSSVFLTSAELYDPAMGTWAATGSLAPINLAVYSATTLQDGRVLVVGGILAGYSIGAALYDPSTGAWTAASAPPAVYTGGADHTATLLQDGRVLVAGGYAAGVGYRASVVYSPGVNQWAVTALMPTDHFRHTATLLPNGKVLVAGGATSSGVVLVANAELFDPSTGTWTATGSMATAREWHSASLLHTGEVLVAGGQGNPMVLSSAELYNPVTGAWSPADSMGLARYEHDATVLGSGQVLVSAGVVANNSLSAELYTLVTNVAPVVTAGQANINVDEGASALNNGTVSDADGDHITLSASVGSVSATGDGTWSWSYTPVDGPSGQVVTVSADDGHGGIIQTSFDLTVANVAPAVVAGPDALVPLPATFSGNGSFSDPGADQWSATVDYGDGSGVQPLGLHADKTFALSHAYNSAGSYTVNVTVTDDDGGLHADSLLVTVPNTVPQVSISAPGEGAIFPVGTAVQFAGAFADYDAADTHSATWTLAADGPTVLTVPGAVTPGSGGGSVSASYTFAAPGVYRVSLVVTDSAGGSGSAQTIAGDLLAMVVIFDPLAGSVTGHGWITSPPGAYTPDANVSGKASFGILSKYKPGAAVPDGHADFDFRAADFHLVSRVQEWLVVSGARAQFKGSGHIEGQAEEVGYLCTVIDGQLTGGGGTDRFRLKVWVQATGQILYDSGLGASDNDPPAIALGGGKIMIKK